MNTDVLVLIIAYLDLDDRLRLGLTCKHFNDVLHLGWPVFLRTNQRHSLSLHVSRSRSSPLAQVRYDTLTDRAWSRASFVARPLARPWPGRLQPVIALSVSTLLVAAGRTLYSYAVRHAAELPSHIVFECSYVFAACDITSMAFLTGEDRTVLIGFEDGSVEKICLPTYRGSNQGRHAVMTRAPQSAIQHHSTDVVKGISCSSHVLLSLSQWGSVLLTDLASHSSTSLNLRTRSWASHLCTSAPSPYAVFGTTSPAPLSLHYITPDEVSPTPSIVLQSPNTRLSAVYGITCAPPSSPLGPSEQIIVSGWYDGSVRIYDLRVPSQCHLDSGLASASSLPPVLTLRDPWLPEPIYTVSCGGGSASFVAAGMARHSVVAFWDVRQPSRGWSVYAPSNDPSPVYSIVLESSRLFGATQSRPFIFDFGPGVTKDTYPPITPTPPNARRGIQEDRLKPERNGIGFHVSKYSHHRTTLTG